MLNLKYQHISFLSNTCNPLHLGARRRNRTLYWRIVWDATKALRWPLWRACGAMLRSITPNAMKPSRVGWIASMCSRPRENGEYSKTHIIYMTHKESSSEYMSTCKFHMSIPNESWLWPVGGEPARADIWTWQDIRCSNSGEKRLIKETIGPQPGLAMRIYLPMRITCPPMRINHISRQVDSPCSSMKMFTFLKQYLGRALRIPGIGPNPGGGRVNLSSTGLAGGLGAGEPDIVVLTTNLKFTQKKH